MSIRIFPEVVEMTKILSDLSDWASTEDQATSGELAHRWVTFVERFEKNPPGLSPMKWREMGLQLGMRSVLKARFERLSSRHPETSGLFDRLYLALLRAGAWEGMATKEGNPKVGPGFLDRLVTMSANDCPVTLAWLLQAVTPENVHSLFDQKPYKVVRVADGGFTQRMASTWAVLLRQLPLESLQDLILKGADPNADDGQGWPVCCHARGYDPDPVRVEWLIEHGADPLNPDLPWEARQKAWVGVARGWGDLLTGQKTPASSVVTDYVLSRLAQWPLMERSEALDRLQEEAPEVRRCLIAATLESRLQVSRSGRISRF